MLFLLVAFRSNANQTTKIESKAADCRACDCAQMARTTVLKLAESTGNDPNGEKLDAFLEIYHELYLGCYNS